MLLTVCCGKIKHFLTLFVCYSLSRQIQKKILIRTYISFFFPSFFFNSNLQTKSWFTFDNSRQEGIWSNKDKQRQTVFLQEQSFLLTSFQQLWSASYMLKLSLTELLTIQEPKPCCNRYALSTLLASWYGFAILFREKNRNYENQDKNFKFPSIYLF